MTRDIFSDSSSVITLIPQTITADTAGTGVKLAGYQAANVEVQVGNSGDTLSGALFISLELQESLDDITYTAVADADILGATGGGSGQFALINAPAGDSNTFRCGYRGSQLYIRPYINLTGTHTSGTPIGAAVQRFFPDHSPVS